MKIGRKRPKKSEKPPVSLGTIAKENLPFPVVYYPNCYGTFFAFAKDEHSPISLCLCSKPIIENVLRLKEIIDRPQNSDPLKTVPLDNSFFPDIVSEVSLKFKHSPLDSLNFVKGLCHRCNLITPSLRYCHEMYGVEFIQHFGWYFNQAYLRLGIYPMYYFFLPDVCPQEYQQDITNLKKTRDDYQKEYDKLNKLVYSPKRNDIAPDEITYWSNVKIEEAQEMIKLRRIAAQTERAFTKKIENIVRQEFGFTNVGEGWVGETILHQIIQRIFLNNDIYRHYRPDWLEGLELDIFIPALNIAFEYQGQQHFYPIKAWGGQRALELLRHRDERKAVICTNRGIKLITVDYTEPLTEDYILKILKEKQLIS